MAKQLLAIALCITVISACSPRQRRVVIDNPDNDKRKEKIDEQRVLKLGESFNIDVPLDKHLHLEAVWDKKILKGRKTSETICLEDDKDICLQVVSYVFKAVQPGKTLLKFQLKKGQKTLQSSVQQVLVTKELPERNKKATPPDFKKLLAAVPRALTLTWQQPQLLKLKTLPANLQYQFVANTAGFIISQVKRGDMQEVSISPQAIGSSTIILRVVDAALEEQARLNIAATITLKATHKLRINEPLLVQTFSSAQAWKVSSSNNAVQIKQQASCRGMNDCIGKHTLRLTTATRAEVVFTSGEQTFRTTLEATASL